MEKVVGQILHQLATDGSNRHGSKYSNTRSTTTDDIKIGLGSSRVKYMRTFNQRSDNFVLSAIIMILSASTIWISSVSALSQQQTSLGVKITDLAKGQQVAIGKNFTLSGTPSYNATSSCGVFVIVDGVRPYQKTTPIGQTGGNDYFKWKYTFTPAYAGTIREGINRITASSKSCKPIDL